MIGSFLGFPWADFAQFLMETYLHRIFYTLVKSPSFYLFSKKIESTSKITTPNQLLPPTLFLKKRLKKLIKKKIPNRIFPFLLESTRERVYFDTISVSMSCHFFLVMNTISHREALLSVALLSLIISHQLDGDLSFHFSHSLQ